MAETRKVKLPDGRMVDGVDVAIEESVERWSDVLLKDGTRIRVKVSPIWVARTGEFDAAGNPYYSINMTPTIAITSVPDHLKKKPQ